MVSLGTLLFNIQLQCESQVSTLSRPNLVHRSERESERRRERGEGRKGGARERGGARTKE